MEFRSDLAGDAHLQREAGGSRQECLEITAHSSGWGGRSGCWSRAISRNSPRRVFDLGGEGEDVHDDSIAAASKKRPDIQRLWYNPAASESARTDKANPGTGRHILPGTGIKRP